MILCIIIEHPCDYSFQTLTETYLKIIEELYQVLYHVGVGCGWGRAWEFRHLKLLADNEVCSS